MNTSNYFFLTVCFVLFLTRLDAQQFYFSKEKPASCSATDGIVTLVPTRGVPPFTYLWSTGATEVSLKNLPKGTYSATLTDATGATVAHTSILNTKELDLFLSYSRPGGGCNPNSGALTVDPVGGQAPYTYFWSNGMTDAAIQGLSIGAYALTVLDANGCAAEAEFEVTPIVGIYWPTAILGTLAQPDCQNPNAGELNAVMTYSTYPPYNYMWSTGATDESIPNVSKGIYSVTITDALGCSASATATLDNKLIANGSAICSGNNNGTASAQLVNGAAPVTYAWSNGQVGANLSGLVGGYYGITATDANGCSAENYALVVFPSLYFNDFSQDCFSGNQGFGYCSVNSDQGLSYLWDDGGTNFWNNTLSPGNHTITVTTALGCTLTGSMTIDQPIAPAITISTLPSPADCSLGLGGAMNLTLSGGIGPLSIYVSGPNGFLSTDIASLQNLKSGDYFVSAYKTGLSCNAYANVTIPDASGFEPEFVVSDLDCLTGYGSAAVLNVSAPNVQYDWSNGASGPATFNLTAGCYSVTVEGIGSCIEYFSLCLPFEDTIKATQCNATVTGRLINDLGIPGCTGTQGIPYQMVRTSPSGALTFTDENGNYEAALPNGTFDLELAQYNPGEIVCPANAKHTVNSVIGTTLSGLDFHFLSNNGFDLRVQQKPLRTAQPGYPYSLQVEVCNDGLAAVPGNLDLEYGNLLGPLSGHQFAQHPGAFVLNTENAGSPNNTGNFNFPGIAAGACELLQLDLSVATTTPVNTEFISEAMVSPSGGDPTPANNFSTLYNTVVGSYDPNVVLAFPARNGNPKDGGQIIRNEDNSITYQIFFQNTGNAPADRVIIVDSLDAYLDISTIRNISASHSMKLVAQDDLKTLAFKFDNINLPDSTSDYAGSIGFVQYQIDLKPGIPAGTEVNKQAAIFFDFNAPVITNQNVLEVVNSTKVTQVDTGNSIVLFPNPTDVSVGFYCDTAATMFLYNTLGDLISTQNFETGLQQINTADLPNGMYLLRLDSNGKRRSGKLVVSH
jgi:hypothetical protein